MYYGNPGPRGPTGETGATGPPGPAIAGLSSDGAGGIIVAHAITAGDRTATDIPDFHTFYGSTVMQDTPGNNADGDPTAQVRQQAVVGDGQGPPQALIVTRSGNIALSDYVTEVLGVSDQSDSGNPAVFVRRLGGSSASLVTPLAESALMAGHVGLAGAAPTVSHSGTNAVGTLLRATDVRGIINIVLTSTGSAANAELCTVTFAVAYAAAPIIVVSALDDATATALPLGAFYTDQTTNPTTTFMLKCTSALAAGTYRCAYVILG